MRGTAKALVDFLQSFNLPAFMIGTVPDDISRPYLTFPLNEPEWQQKASFYIQGWYRTTSNEELLAKADEIIRTIGEGIRLDMESGYLAIYPETPICQVLVSGDWRSFYINLSINSYHLPGFFPEEGE